MTSERCSRAVALFLMVVILLVLLGAAPPGILEVIPRRSTQEVLVGAKDPRGYRRDYLPE
jgi:hypothetical protein